MISFIYGYKKRKFFLLKIPKFRSNFFLIKEGRGVEGDRMAGSIKLINYLILAI